MKNKRSVPLWVGIVGFILIVAGLAWTIFSMFGFVPPDNHTTEAFTIHILTVILLLNAFIYMITGYGKLSAVYFRTTTYIYTATSFLTAVLTREGPIFLPVFAILSFGIMCVLAFARDLGEKKSVIFCTLNALISLARIIVYFIVIGQLPGGMFGNLICALVLWTMVRAKYSDKAARGTK